MKKSQFVKQESIKAVKNPKKGRRSRKEKLAKTPEMVITALGSEMSVNNVAKLFKFGESEATKRARKQLKEHSGKVALFTSRATFIKFLQWVDLMEYKSPRSAAAGIVAEFIANEAPTVFECDSHLQGECRKRSGTYGVTDEGVLNGEKRKQQTIFDFSEKAYKGFMGKLVEYCSTRKLTIGGFVSECIERKMREFKFNKLIPSTVLEESHEAFEQVVGFNPANAKPGKSKLKVAPVNSRIVQVKPETRVKRLAKDSERVGRKIEKRIHKILKSKQGINLRPNQMFTADDLLRIAMLENAFEANKANERDR